MHPCSCRMCFNLGNRDKFELSHMKKLITSWILFSLISLFDLIEWVPFWPYTKIMAIWWLVFTSAYYAYKRLVLPGLSVLLQVVINLLIEAKEFALETKTFLAVVERHGGEALEKLFASKSNCKELSFAPNNTRVKELTENNAYAAKRANFIHSGCKEPIFAQKGTTVEEITEKIAAAAERMKRVDANLAMTRKKTVAAMEVKEMTVPVAGGKNDLIMETVSKKLQKECTCDVCQVQTQSEENMNSFINRIQRLTAMCEELETSMQTTKNNGSSSLIEYKLDQSKQVPKTNVFGNGLNQNEAKKQEDKLQVNFNSEQGKQKNAKNSDARMNHKYWCGICSVTCPGEIDMASHVDGRKHLSQIQEMIANGDARANGPKYWCGICLVTCPGEIDMASHLNGMKHLSRIEEMIGNGDARMNGSRYWCGVCRVTCSGEIDMTSHLNGREHLSRIQEMIRNGDARKNGSNYWCGICRVPCPGEIGMASHLKGRKHWSRIQLMVGNGNATNGARYWCGVCNVTCPGEIDMARHLNGREHLSRIQEMITNDSFGMNGSKYCCGICCVTCPGEIGMASQLKGRQHLSQIQQMIDNGTARTNWAKYWCGLCSVTCPGKIDMASHLNGRQHLSRIQEMIANGDARANGSKYWCGLCCVTCPGEIDMASHLNGSKHLSRIQAMIDDGSAKTNRSTYWCGICNVSCPSEIDMASHLSKSMQIIIQFGSVKLPHTSTENLDS